MGDSRLQEMKYLVCSKLRNQCWNPGLLTPGLVLFKLHFEKKCVRQCGHAHSHFQGRMHSPCHGVSTCNFLLRITQIPSLFIGSILEEWWGLEEPAVLEVFFDDNVCNCIKHKFDILGVCSTGHVTVDFFDVFPHIEVKELTLDIIPCILIRVVPWFSRKIVKKWGK